MKYTVKFSCGHTATVELLGAYKDRERKIAWYAESGLCPCCFEAKKEAENAEGCREVEMHYGEYKEKFADCKTKAGSYNKATKTIIVYVPVEEEPEQDEEPETEPDVEMELAEIESESGETMFVSPDAKPLDGKRVRAFVTVKIPGYYAKRVTWEDGVNLVLFRESDDADPDDPYDAPDLDAITFTDDGKPALWFFRDGRNIKIELEVVGRRPNRVAHTF